MTSSTIAVLPGDGIGPEVTDAAVRVCRAAMEQGGHDFEVVTGQIGGAAMDATGDPLPAKTLEQCRAADAVLLGAVGGPQWDVPDATVRPEQGLLGLRGGLSVFANLRPVSAHPMLAHTSPVRPEILDGVDILFVRELTGGIYFGDKQRTDDRASDECVYTIAEIERITRTACELATKRRGVLTSVDKANILETSRLWRSTVTRITAEEYPDLEVEHLLVDAMAMYLMNRPRDFDVVVTENMFGDILTDEASVLAGSLGMLPSASIGDGGPGLYEPVHGSAPDLVGRGIANPCGAILSGAMMLRHSLDLDEPATAIERAVWQTLSDGILPRDLCGHDGGADTGAVVTAIIERLGN